MSGQVPPLSSRRSTSMYKRNNPSTSLRKSLSTQSENGTTATGASNGYPLKSPLPTPSGERTVKKLRLSKALTIPEGTSVSDACRRMAARRVDAVLLTDANALLSGIVTDKDIATRVLAEELRPDQTVISKVMTRNPTFVSSDTLAIDALQKMVQGKFRHLPVVENGEVIALLDITKCLYDAISRMEKAAEQGSAIAAAVEGVERQWGNNFSAPSAFIETIRDRMFKPSLSSIIAETSKVATVLASDPVYVAAKRMLALQVNSVIIMAGNNIQGILTSKDLLMRVVAQNLSPELTLVEKVMTPSPECATVDTTILEALHIMHDGKFLHLPVIDKDGSVVACVDVLQITHAAISMAENNSGADVANTVMQKFWDSALNLEPPDDYDDSQSEMSMSAIMTSDAMEGGRSYPSLGLGNSFAFKFEDLRGRVHRFNFGMMLEATRKHLYWTPCAAHCIDMMLEDIGKIPKVRNTLKSAMFMNAYIYNHVGIVNMMSFTNQRNLHRPAVTRFATSFITLSQMHKQKNNLRKMITSPEWNNSKWSKDASGKRLASIILQERFWRNMVYALKLTGPLVKVLRIVDGDKKPAMGYIETIAASFLHKEDQYKKAFEYIDAMWDCQLHRPLHAAGFFLNPKMYYENPEHAMCAEVMKGLYDCIQRLVPDSGIQDKIGEQLDLYQNAQGLFGNPMAVRQRSKRAPGTENLGELVSAITQRMGSSLDQNCPQLLYEDDEGDRVLLTTDADLVGAVNHARSAGQKVLRLHLDYSDFSHRKSESQSLKTIEEQTVEPSKSRHLQVGILASAAVVAGIACVVYLKRSNH